MTPSNSGYIYLIGSTNFGWYKIGRTRRPSVRLRDIGLLLPFKIELVALWYAANSLKAETEFHKRYSFYSINGEWFGFGWRFVEEVLQASYENASRVELSDALMFSNIKQDPKIATHRHYQKQIKDKAFMAAVAEYLRATGLESTKENIKAAKAKISPLFKFKSCATIPPVNV